MGGAAPDAAVGRPAGGADADNARAVGRLATHHSQERFVAPMGKTFADALHRTSSTHARGALVSSHRGAGELVGFLMIRRLHATRRHPLPVAAAHRPAPPGRGIGTRAVGLLVDHLHALGRPRLDVSWHVGRGGPEPFYRKLGFVPDGRVIKDEHIARLHLG